MCPGSELGRMMLFLFGARILHRFQLAAPLDQTIDLEVDSQHWLLEPRDQKILFIRRL